MLLAGWATKLVEASLAAAGVSLASISAGSARGLLPPGVFSNPTPVVPPVQDESSNPNWAQLDPSVASVGTFTNAFAGVVIKCVVAVVAGPGPYEISVLCAGYGSKKEITVASGRERISEPPCLSRLKLECSSPAAFTDLDLESQKMILYPSPAIVVAAELVEGSRKLVVTPLASLSVIVQPARSTAAEEGL